MVVFVSDEFVNLLTFDDEDDEDVVVNDVLVDDIVIDEEEDDDDDIDVNDVLVDDDFVGDDVVDDVVEVFELLLANVVKEEADERVVVDVVTEEIV